MQAQVRKGLTKSKILEESQALVDAGGPAALTMRALAARLGVAAMAIYNHFQDRDAILDAIADHLFEQLRQTALHTTESNRRTGWRRRIRTLVLAAQHMAMQHPHIFRIAMSRPNKPASAFALAEDSIRILKQAGLTHTQALTAYHTFVILLQGYPFWHEGVQQHETIENCAADVQFEAIIDWLLNCIADIKKK